MKSLRRYLDELHPKFARGGSWEKLYPLYEGIDTFLYTPSDTTSEPSHMARTALTGTAHACRRCVDGGLPAAGGVPALHPRQRRQHGQDVCVDRGRHRARLPEGPPALWKGLGARE